MGWATSPVCVYSFAGAQVVSAAVEKRFGMFSEWQLFQKLFFVVVLSHLPQADVASAVATQAVEADATKRPRTLFLSTKVFFAKNQTILKCCFQLKAIGAKRTFCVT